MTKQEAIAKIKKALAESEITNAKQTLANVNVKEKDVKAAEGMPKSELPTQKDVEKVVANAEPTLVSADKDGVSKNGGEKDVMDNEKIEAERKKEDNAMKDVINVADRKVEENSEVQPELLQ